MSSVPEGVKNKMIPNEIGSAEFAELLGVTDRYIRKLSSENIIQKSGTRGKYLFKESLQGYLELIKSSNSGNANLKDIKLRKETEKLEKDIELKSIRIAELKNDLHSAEIVEKVMTTMLLNLKGKLLSVPNKVAPIVVGCENLGDIQSVIQEVIEDTLLELSEYSKDLFKNTNIMIEEEGDDEMQKEKKVGRKTREKPKKNN